MKIPQLQHISGNFTDARNNNVIERANKTLKTRIHNIEKFGSLRTGRELVDGFRLYYNMIRPHRSLNNTTPGDASGLRRESKNVLFEFARQDRRNRITKLIELARQENSQEKPA